MFPDKYIYDSQFGFLNSNERLQDEYLNSLAKTDVFKSKDGLAYYRAEDWDSRKFNKKFGRLIWVEDNAPDNFYLDLIIELKKFDCCYIRLNKEHAFCKFAVNKGLQVLSKKVSQHIDLNKQSLNFDPALTYLRWEKKSSDYPDNILSQVLELAKTSFKNNRFKADKHFSPHDIESIYGNWVMNEINSGQSRLFVVLENELVASFFLYRENISPLSEYKIGFVSLIAASPAFKKQNYSSHLLNFVLNKANKNNTQFVIANTESTNKGALDFFNKNNFLVTSHLNEYHLWN